MKLSVDQDTFSLGCVILAVGLVIMFMSIAAHFLREGI